jgi:hypothetical protein
VPAFGAKNNVMWVAPVGISAPANVSQDFVVPVFLGTSSRLSFTQANNQTFFFVRAGGKVRADFNTLDATSTFLECRIAGNLVPL